MGNRISKVYTRTGDEGTTGTATGDRVAKDDLLIHVQGELDELNSSIALLVCEVIDGHRELLIDIQHDLFDIGGEITLDHHSLTQDRVDSLERQIDAFNRTLQPLREFILPGGNRAGSVCHLARAVSRRAERSMVALSRQRELNPVSMSYINRLSDLLFVFARVLNDQGEIYWRSDRFKVSE